MLVTERNFMTSAFGAPSGECYKFSTSNIFITYLQTLLPSIFLADLRYSINARKILF